ncbi:TIGR03943 family protein [Cytobacillus depressus]|uniref:TIGR03943 family protein n=1 Tax=Cytobacillus depressus TaxID=1602942 RepID=A0A6L3V6I7_9BACI|nr:TIGR03943 family protein [Cytobacillus depressus]KAB2334817.1 TIGR03943 family protein [Cytobacillus depressus]
MNFRFQQAIRALILLSFPILIFKLHFTGEILKFINPKYDGLSIAAAILFLVLFLIQLTRIWITKEHQHHHCHHEDHERCDHNHDHGDTPFNLKKLFSYMVIVFPLITGFLLPAKVLDASIANKKGGMAIITNQKQASKGGTNSQSNQTDNKNDDKQSDVTDNEFSEKVEAPTPTEHTIDPKLAAQEEMSEEEYEQLKKMLAQKPSVIMEQSVFATYYEDIHMDIQKYKGKTIQLTGFAYKEDDFEKNQLVIARFFITHCVADASIVGFLTELPEAASVDTDTWIELRGVLDITTYNGMELPFIKITEWKKVGEPEEPYIYPKNIRIL